MILRRGILVGLAAFLATTAACGFPDASEYAIGRTATATPEPTPTWTPIPFATATPTPESPVLTRSSAPDAKTPIAMPTLEDTASPAESPIVSAPTPTGLVPITDDELLVRLLGSLELPDDPLFTVSRPGQDEFTADVVGLAGQFLDPLVVRRSDPFLLALVLVGRAGDSLDLQVVTTIIESPDKYLGSFALGLVESFQAADRAAEVTELELLPSPWVGYSSSAARTQVASGADVFEARLAVAVRDGVAGLVIQLARLDGVADFLDAAPILGHIVDKSLVQG